MGVPGAWAQVVLLLLLLMAVATEAQNSGCTIQQLIDKVTENDSEALNQPLANIRRDPGIDVILTNDSKDFFELRAQSQGQELFLNKTPDFEVQRILLANMECRSGNVVVSVPQPQATQGSRVRSCASVSPLAPPGPPKSKAESELKASRVLGVLRTEHPAPPQVGKLTMRLEVTDLNDNAPEFPEKTYTKTVPEDAKVDTIVIPAKELQATDKDVDNLLYYTLREETPHAATFFSLASRIQPGLKLRRRLNYAELPSMTFKLVVHDTENDSLVPRHSAEATLVVEVLPADLRPPWFLPCVYNDSSTCIQAQYNTTLPINVPPPKPLKMCPGPIYAVDGDWAINEKIIYSLPNEGVNSIFSIDPETGNLTMQRSVDSPTTFQFVVKAAQKSDGHYSVTQVTVEVTSNKSHVSFPLNLYRGFVVLGHGANVAVKDSADPSQPLTLRARDITFPQYNRDFQYRITDNNRFQMEGEAVLTTNHLVDPGVYTATVEANNTATQSSGSTKVEIQVLSPPTPPPGTTTNSTSSSGTSQAVTSGTVATAGTVTGTVAAPGTGTGTWTVPAGSEDGDSGTHPESESLRFSAVHMAALGGVLGALLLVTLLALSVLVHKHYGHRCCCSRSSLSQPEGYDNKTFAVDSEDNWAPASSPAPSPAPVKKAPAPPTPPSTATPSPPASPATPVAPATPEGGSTEGVRSILTKDRRSEGGYKAVWFGEDIGAEADVVVLNSPTVDAQAGSDSDRDSDQQGDSGSEDGAHGDATYI
ncbi:cadherin-related family member 5 [Suncus etruscus]|uniref:cadherin-related family member 5 n=1 Tax=Suncus etruscus TaxID=109475 RepID=UPI00211001BD|nr:cadherin-related family member 5 [Suncus etruscus]